MKNFKCGRCGNKVYFGNVRCVRCDSDLGFDASTLSIVALDPVDATTHFKRVSGPAWPHLKYCTNHQYGACNWLTPAEDKNGLCIACGLNRTIPNLSETGSIEAWCDLERAKKRLVYSLMRFNLSLDGPPGGNGRLAFEFMRDVGTGHLDGVITIDVVETDSVERERQRQSLGEQYRTVLGHLRHESGHFYWMVLVEAAGKIASFRSLFGDERQDYAQALNKHYADGPPADWQTRFVSAYASAHPWEDWAETWAHYLHMVDALDTAEAEGMEPRTAGFMHGTLWPFRRYDIYRDDSFESLMDRWIPLALALNSLSRSMGHVDFYPFVISAPAYDKLAFIHRLIHQHVGRRRKR